MMAVDKVELRRLAEAATQGDWEFRLGMVRTLPDSDGYVGIAVSPSVPRNWRNQRDMNMQYIAAASPSTVLALMDEIDRLQATCDGLDRQNDAIAQEVGASESERVRLVSELEACRKDAGRYRWLCRSQWYAGPWPDDEENGYRSNDKNWTTELLSQSIDTAMSSAKEKDDE